MYRIDTPHPVGGRTFPTREDAERVAGHFGVPARIVPAKEAE
jgi:hypothetical protein